jgi:hypothetical protein
VVLLPVLLARLLLVHRSVVSTAALVVLVMVLPKLAWLRPIVWLLVMRALIHIHVMMRMLARLLPLPRPPPLPLAMLLPLPLLMLALTLLLLPLSLALLLFLSLLRMLLLVTLLLVGLLLLLMLALMLLLLLICLPALLLTLPPLRQGRLRQEEAALLPETYILNGLHVRIRKPPRQERGPTSPRCSPITDLPT